MPVRMPLLQNALEQRIVNMQAEQGVAICELHEMMIREDNGA